MIAGIQFIIFPFKLILKIQSPRTIVSLGRFYSLPLRVIVWFSSLKRKFIWFSFVILFNASLIRYSSKKISDPSISSQGLSSMVQSSPKLYFTCTRQLYLFTKMSLLSTQLSSKRITSKQSSLPNYTASQSILNDEARAEMKSEGYWSPISMCQVSWCVGKGLIETDRLQFSRYSRYVVLVEYTFE